MDFLKAVCCCILLSSCAKLNYIFEQSTGQLALEYNDIEVEDFLQNQSQKISYRKKVEIILRAKKYFYDYFSLKDPGIYDEVKMLDRDAVTYLVVHSPKDKIKAMSTWFPFLGKFPYLGFFSLDSAQGFKRKKEKEGFSTYMRPVYAYSTLNHPLMPFDDNILSSFFHYSERDLVELIFHELTHTVFFVRDHVGLNESLANFIAEKLLIDYYSMKVEEKKILRRQRVAQQQLIKKIGDLGKQLDRLYVKKTTTSQEVLSTFLEENFLRQVKQTCEELKIKKCWALEGKWNNARFAALGTYYSHWEEIEKIFKKLGLSLKDFVKELAQSADDFDKSSEENFLTYFEDRL